MTETGLAREAMDKANIADGKIDSHEVLCTLRYANLEAGLARLTKLITWGGGIIVTIMLSLLGWSLSSQVNNNADAIHDLQNINAIEAGRVAQAPSQRPPVEQVVQVNPIPPK